MGVRRNQPMGLGIFVVERLDELGMSQRELAAESGLTESAISRIISAERRNPGGETLLKLARGLGVTVDTLLSPPGADTTTKKVIRGGKQRANAGTGVSRKRTAAT